ncbi:MAG TPA: phage tail protein [Candidatus Saccharimonadales bacterium]|jgi:phage tail-like protein|nr:phage tail protein [Candidatus Saccharimonadales bacterium]
MPPGSTAPRGLAARFQVTIDGQNLGAWSKCTGLSVDFQHEVYKELGNNSFVHLLPMGAKYEPITLERACTAAESVRLQGWLASMVTQPKKGTASITLHDAAQQEVITWTLSGVFPAKWTGPHLEGKSTEVAFEALVLAHEGFLD